MAFILISAAMAVITVLVLHRIDEGGSPAADLRRAADWVIAASREALSTIRRIGARRGELRSHLSTAVVMLTGLRGDHRRWYPWHLILRQFGSRPGR
jgi:hypothetical protein